MNSSICESAANVGLVYWKVSTNSSIVDRFVDDRSSRYVDQVDFLHMFKHSLDFMIASRASLTVSLNFCTV